ncbi:MAG: response regulator [Roseateles sp.]|uniref:response regulator n=2 Tax=Roseateles sp. TaxID=1971397 RepID=UPI004037408C
MSNVTNMTPVTSQDLSGEPAAVDVLTSRAAALRCGVSFRTVIRWIERGTLGAYRLPGRGDYRIARTELQRFMKEYGIPDPDAPVDSRKRVLVVDDEPAMAAAIKRVLARAGYETAVASDGFLAGSLLHTFKPGLMTLDLQMPGIDGFGVLRLLRETPTLAALKVLVISGESEVRLRQALAEGANETLPKPFANEHLLQAVQRLVGAPP